VIPFSFIPRTRTRRRPCRPRLPSNARHGHWLRPWRGQAASCPRCIDHRGPRHG
jgi:hypothetical protein